VRHSDRIPFHVNPHLAAASLEMGLTLDDLGYSRHYVDQIIRHAAAAGTIVGSPVDPEDEAAVEAAFVEALDAMNPVPYDDPAWDRDTAVIFDAAMLAAGNHPWPIPTDFDGAMAADDAAMAMPDPARLADWRGPEEQAFYDAWLRDRDGQPECKYGYE
jgi:hypothetical protein